MELLTLLISALSLLVAVAAIVYAVYATGAAKKDAKNAIQQADTANQLSADANVIAEDSKSIAIESRKIGEEALTVARRADLRESDTSNIHWEFRWEEPGVYVITNRGDDEALNVRIIIDVDEEKVSANHESIPGGGSVKIECPQAKATYMREISEYRAKVRDYERNRSVGFGFGLPPDTFQYSYHSANQRIDWVTKSGKPGTYDKHYPIGLLGDFS